MIISEKIPFSKIFKMSWRIFLPFSAFSIRNMGTFLFFLDCLSIVHCVHFANFVHFLSKCSSIDHKWKLLEENSFNLELIVWSIFYHNSDYCKNVSKTTANRFRFFSKILFLYWPLKSRRSFSSLGTTPNSTSNVFQTLIPIIPLLFWGARVVLATLSSSLGSVIFPAFQGFSGNLENRIIGWQLERQAMFLDWDDCAHKHYYHDFSNNIKFSRNFNQNII